jgi:hypothetical protein
MMNSLDNMKHLLKLMESSHDQEYKTPKEHTYSELAKEIANMVTQEGHALDFTDLQGVADHVNATLHWDAMDSGDPEHEVDGSDIASVLPEIQTMLQAALEKLRDQASTDTGVAADLQDSSYDHIQRAIDDISQVVMQEEKLNELSPELLGRARDKSISRASDIANRLRSEFADHPFDRTSSYTKKEVDRADKFHRGMEKAADRDEEDRFAEEVKVHGERFDSKMDFSVDGESYTYALHVEDDEEARRMFHYVFDAAGNSHKLDWSRYNIAPDQRDLELWVKLGMPTREDAGLSGPLDSEILAQMAQEQLDEACGDAPEMAMSADQEVVYSKTHRKGDASVTVSATAKDSQQLEDILRMAGMDPALAQSHMPEPEVPEMPAVVEPEAPYTAPADISYSTDSGSLKQHLLSRMQGYLR